jgi:hypothetical protein
MMLIPLDRLPTDIGHHHRREQVVSEFQKDGACLSASTTESQLAEILHC